MRVYQVNRPLRRLSKQLLSVVEEHDSVRFEELDFSACTPLPHPSSSCVVTNLSVPSAKSNSFPDKFVQYALAHGVDGAIDNFWS
jgi:hypothetical protein